MLGGRRPAVGIDCIRTSEPDPAAFDARVDAVENAVDDEELVTGGVATPNFLNAPDRFRSKNTAWEFNVDKANQILDAAGWKRGSDGIRTHALVSLSSAVITLSALELYGDRAAAEEACVVCSAMSRRGRALCAWRSFR